MLAANRYRGNIIFDDDLNYYYICAQQQGFQLYKHDKRYNLEKQITFDSNYPILDLYKNSSETILLLISEQERNLNSLWILSDESEHPTKVAPNRGENCLQGITDESGKIIIYNSINEKGITSIKIFNIEKLKERTLYYHDGYCVIGELSPSGRYLPVLVSLEGLNCKLVIIDLELNAIKENKWSEQGVSIELITWDSDEVLFFLNSTWDDNNTLYKWHINQNSPEKCFNSNGVDIEEVVFINSNNIIFKTNESGISRLYSRNLLGNENKLIFKQDSYISKMNINHKKNTLALRISTISKNESIYFFSLDNFTLEPPLKDNEETILVEDVRIKRSDSTHIPALLYKQKGKAIKKVFIYLHGGPHSQHIYTFHPVINEIMLSSSDTAILAPNIIGSSGYGKSYMEPVYGNWGDLDVKDIEYIIKWIDEQSNWKNKQVYIGGISYGGYLALLSVGQNSYKWSGVISVNGPTDLADFKSNLPRRMQESILKTDDTVELLNRSPHSNIKGINCPILIIQSKFDSKVSSTTTENYCSELIKAKKDYKLVYLHDKHEIETVDSLEIIIDEINTFLNLV